MNYQKVYESIILKAFSKNRIKLRKNQKDYIYYENHHITPKCLGGSNDKSNLILLTAREHYICHKLLTYIYKGNTKIVMAFFRMTFDKNNRNISSKDYAYAKELMSITPKSKETKKLIKDNHSHYWKGKVRSEESKEKERLKFKDKPKTKEHCENISKGRLGIIFSKEHCENIRKSKSGKNNPFYGKKRPEHSLRMKGENNPRWKGKKNEIKG